MIKQSFAHLCSIIIHMPYERPERRWRHSDRLNVAKLHWSIPGIVVRRARYLR
jgi:hypothetical protein